MQLNIQILSFKFSQTYRKLDEQETDSAIRQRHRNYYWMGRCLRECVECFGMSIKQNPGELYLRVYHGLNQQFVFESMYLKISGPFSTTTSYPVAVRFCENRGMILDLSLPFVHGHIKMGLAPSCSQVDDTATGKACFSIID